MKIAFHSNQISIRGTEVALYDYAKYNEELLGNESIIISKNPEIQSLTNLMVVKKFKKRFNVFFYNNFTEVEKILNDQNIDIFYAIKAGMNDGIISKNRKSVIHTVFQHYQPHGNVYAYVSEWLGNKYNKPFVPHMINLPNVDGNLRDELNISKTAIVFGRYGGYDTFNVPFSKECVKDIAQKNSNIYFLFMNTEKFTENSLRNVIYLDGSENLERKVRFIQTCDAHLHARTQGESFGLVVGEFAVKNKPTITWTGGRDKAHLKILGGLGLYYSNKSDLLNILSTFKPDLNKDWDCYSSTYNPNIIMEKFNNVFIK